MFQDREMKDAHAELHLDLGLICTNHPRKLESMLKKFMPVITGVNVKDVRYGGLPTMSFCAASPVLIAALRGASILWPT